MIFTVAFLFFSVTPQSLDQEIIPHFTLREFTCRTCQEVVLHKELLTRLGIFRRIYGRQIHITSAYRNIEDNIRVDGASNSLHLSGKAVDIALPKRPKRMIWIAGKVFPFVKVNYARNYIHCDIGGD